MERLYYLNRQPRRTPQYGKPLQAWENVESVIAQTQAFLRGVLADGILNTAEADALHRLFQSKSEAISMVGFPLTDLVRRVDEYAIDGVWTEEELADLQQELTAFLNDGAPDAEAAPAQPASMIFTQPCPPIVYPGSEFVLSGQFAWGTKNQVVKAIEGKGGVCHERVRQSTRYVIVGSFVSEGWAHGSYGRKIEAALDLINDGHPIAVVSEADWRSSLE